MAKLPGSRHATDTGAPVALLGPTNTGKTHRAIERMLRHRSGMIGLPLRLLAREVYDRVSARIGERHVALITGEERRIPPEPRYHVCTVEAMPVERPVDFLAVDEVQLCGDRARGHVFTDRVLHARGRRRTLWMGSDIIAPLLRRLVPDVRIERHGRFSSLTHAGPRKLASLPPRTAIVAFSMGAVYELAERVRQRHGGTALVLGALSPRTRNAQVAMYQAGEVQYLVATDAIGMGLNLDLDLVAFSALSKWDGVEHRPLRDAEVAQIAGRAGRYRRDGAFGPLSSIGPFPSRLVEALEQHRFPALRQLYWREPRPDMGSLDDLIASLSRPAPRPELTTAPHASDLAALVALARDDEVRDRVTGRDELALLWEACRIPDYRKTWDRDHPELVGEIFVQLLRGGGRLPVDWFTEELEPLDRIAGDAELLMTRLARIRTWSYVAHRADWLDDVAAARARTRRIEDRLSDALHERLTARFVDRRAMLLLGGGAGGDAPEPVVSPGGTVRLGDQVLGQLRGFEFQPAAGLAAEEDRDLLRRVHRRIRPAIEARVEEVVEGADGAFDLDAEARILWNGVPLALLVAGHDVITPKLRMARLDMLGGGARARIERRLTAWVRDRIGGLLDPLRGEALEALSPLARGAVYALELGLGTVPRDELRTQLGELTRRDRRSLAGLGVRLGSQYVYTEPLLEPAVVSTRATLVGVHRGVIPAPVPPAPDAPSFPVQPGVAHAIYAAIGYPVAGPLAVRVDQLERLAALARRRARHGSFSLPGEATEWLECSRKELAAVLGGLGFQHRQDGDGRWGFAWRRRRGRGGSRRRS